MEATGPAGDGAGGNRGDPLRPAAGQNRLRGMIETPARLVRLAPARLGRADRRVRAQGDRRAAARPGGRRAHRRGLRAEGADAWFTRDPRAVPRRRHAIRRTTSRSPTSSTSGSNSGSTHAFVLERRPELALAGLALPRGLGPASRLVPLLAAGELRHARARALRRGADPRLRARRAGPEDVEVARQRGRAAGGVTSTAPTSCACGWSAPTTSEDLRIGAGDPEAARPRPIAGCATRCAICSASWTASTRPSGCRQRDAGAGALGAAPAGRARPAGARGHRGLRVPALYTALHNFCAVDLSAFYFDIRKDALYCDRPDSLRRRAARTVLDAVFDCLTAWLAPILCFTAEEAWLARIRRRRRQRPPADLPRNAGGLAGQRARRALGALRRVRRVVTGALEVERAPSASAPACRPPAGLSSARRMPGCSRASISPRSRSPRRSSCVDGDAARRRLHLADVPGVGVVPRRAAGEKCERCWQVLPEVGDDAGSPTSAAAAPTRSRARGGLSRRRRSGLLRLRPRRRRCGTAGARAADARLPALDHARRHADRGHPVLQPRRWCGTAASASACSIRRRAGAWLLSGLALAVVDRRSSSGCAAPSSG